MILNEDTLNNEFNNVSVNYEELFKQFLNDNSHTFKKVGNSYQYTLYADYNDAFTPKDAREIVESKDVDEAIDSYFDSETWVYAEDEVNELFFDWLNEKGIEKPDQETMLDVQDMGIVSYSIDYDHYLGKEYQARIIVDTGDGNYDFTLNPSYYNNYQGESGEEGEGIGLKASLAWLAQTQGYSIDQLKAALKDGDIKDPSGFLQSARQEAANVTSSMNALVILVKASLKQMVDWKRNPCAISISTECSGKGIGLFDAWNGGGSVLEIELEKPFTIPAEFIREFNVDVNDNYIYSVDDVYGLSGSCYTRCATLAKNEAVNSLGRMRPDTYKKREPIKKPLSLRVYDGLDTLGYEVFASKGNYGFEISKKFEKNLQKAKDFLDSLNVKYSVKPFRNRNYMTIFLPDDSEAIDAYFAKTDKRAANESLKEGFAPGNWRGVEGVKLIDRGSYSDPQLYYKDEDGKEYIANYWDVEDSMWQYFLEETGRKDSESGSADVEELFDKFCQEHRNSVISDIIDMAETNLDESFNASEEVAKQLKNPDPLTMNLARAFAQGNSHILNQVTSKEKTIEQVIDEVAAQSNFLTKEMWEVVIRLAMFCDRKKINEDTTAKAFSKHLGQDDIQYFTKKNQFNYDVKQVRIDNTNKTYEFGAFKITSGRESTKNGREFDRLIDKLKELGYTEIKKNVKESVQEEYTIEINNEIYCDDNGNAYHFDSYDDAAEFIEENELQNAQVTRQHGKAMYEDINQDTFTDNGLASIINTLIQDEFDAIQQYNDAIVNFETEGRQDLVQVLKDIVNEENLHVGQLEVLLEQVNETASSIDQGKIEAETQLNESVE